MECPKCGKPRKEGDSECPYCGIHYLIFDRKQDNGETEAAEETVAVFDSADENAKVTTACPKCGQQYTIQAKQLGLKTKCKKCKTPFETAPME